MGGEGASDICDAIRTLKPKVIVYDFSPGVVAHMRSVDPTFFNRGEGLVIDKDEDIVRKVKASILKANYKPSESHPTVTTIQELRALPGSFAMIDVFHSTNPKKDIDRYGRNIRIIRGIPDRLNSSIAEQIWSSTGRHVKSLTQMNHDNFVAQWTHIVTAHNKSVIDRMLASTSKPGPSQNSRRARAIIAGSQDSIK